MRKHVAFALLSCIIGTPSWAGLRLVRQDQIAGWSYVVLKDDATGELTSDAYLADSGGRGFMSIGCAVAARGKPAVFVMISPRESLGREGESGSFAYRMGSRAAVESGGVFGKAVWHGQSASYIQPNAISDMPRMLRSMTQAPLMEVEISPKTPEPSRKLRFQIGDVRPVYDRIERDCPGFGKAF